MKRTRGNKSVKTKLNVKENGKRKYLSQADVPSCDLKKALKIATAIADNYGKQPTRPLRVAEAIGLEPGSSTFRVLCGASIAYGLTDGGYNAENISLTTLAKRIVAPTVEGDESVAKREALLKPKIIKEFLERYNGSSLPQEKIGINVLEEAGVPKDRAKSVFDLICQSANEVGFIREIKGKSYVDLHSSATSVSEVVSPLEDEENEEDSRNNIQEPENQGFPLTTNEEGGQTNRRVFITHGKNLAFIEPIKKLLQFGELEPVVALEQQTVSQPLTDKVMNEMRGCGAAIIHIDDDKKLIDANGEQHVVLNPNVLIEIGAAIALYERRFILLVKEGIDMPSNLKGLYEVRYTGDSLSSEVTIKLLEAIKAMKSLPSPTLLRKQ